FRGSRVFAFVGSRSASVAQCHFERRIADARGLKRSVKRLFATDRRTSARCPGGRYSYLYSGSAQRARRVWQCGGRVDGGRVFAARTSGEGWGSGFVPVFCGRALDRIGEATEGSRRDLSIPRQPPHFVHPQTLERRPHAATL